MATSWLEKSKLCWACTERYDYSAPSCPLCGADSIHHIMGPQIVPGPIEDLIEEPLIEELPVPTIPRKSGNGK